MPKIAQQSNVAVPQNGSILKRVISVQKMQLQRLFISLYGRPKTGKTRLVCSFPKPLLIIGAENGTKSIRKVDGVDFIQICLREDQFPPDGNGVLYTELPQFAGELVKSKYKTVVIDSATALEEIVLADMLGLTEVPTMWNPSKLAKEWGNQTLNKYGERSMKVRSILEVFSKNPQNFCVVAGEKNFNEDETHADLLSPDIGSALGKGTTRWLNHKADYICQTFIREQTEETVIEGTDTKIKTPTGVKEFCLRVGPHEMFQTGFRVDPGVRIPDVIVDPSYDKIMSVINNTYFKASR